MREIRYRTPDGALSAVRIQDELDTALTYFAPPPIRHMFEELAGKPPEEVTPMLNLPPDGFLGMTDFALGKGADTKEQGVSYVKLHRKQDGGAPEAAQKRTVVKPARFLTNLLREGALTAYDVNERVVEEFTAVIKAATSQEYMGILVPNTEIASWYNLARVARPVFGSCLHWEGTNIKDARTSAGNGSYFHTAPFHDLDPIMPSAKMAILVDKEFKLIARNRVYEVDEDNAIYYDPKTHQKSLRAMIYITSDWPYGTTEKNIQALKQWMHKQGYVGWAEGLIRVPTNLKKPLSYSPYYDNMYYLHEHYQWLYGSGVMHHNPYFEKGGGYYASSTVYARRVAGFHAELEELRAKRTVHPVENPVPAQAQAPEPETPAPAPAPARRRRAKVDGAAAS